MKMNAFKTMRIISILGLALVVGMALAAAPAQAQDSPKIACAEWCKANPDKCVKCSPMVGCGAGYKKIKSFKGKGKNYFACAEIKNPNKVACAKWCAEHPDKCVKCSASVGCGKGYKKIKSFKGKGKDYYACGKLKHDNKAACAEWCKENPDKCVKCSPAIGCGPGYKKVKSFKGKGKDWYACAKR